MKAIITFCFIVIFTSSLFANTTLPKGIIKITARTAPSLSLENMDGERFTLTTSQNKWSYVHFWASWCGPCRKEMPAIQKLIQSMEKDNFTFFIVNTAESEDTIFSFLGGVAPDINTLLDHDGLVTEKWQPRGLPSTYLVDPSGQIQYVVIGGQEWHKAEYLRFLRELSMSNKK